MSLNSKSYLFPIIFSLLGIFFALFWIVFFLDFVIIGNGFSLTNLVLLPILIIPLWIIYIFHHFLNSLKFTKNGVAIYKMVFLKIKSIDWTSLDYSFNTIESGRSGSFKVIYLVKNKKLVLRISESNYKNYTDINHFISSNIEDKGFIKLNFFDSFKYFTKRTIYKLP